VPKPVYALVGNDPYLQLRELRRLLAEFGGDVDRVDIDGERASLADVQDELRCFAMFGGRKIVVVRDADKFISTFRGEMEAFLAAPPDSATLVLRMDSLPATQRIHKVIAKVGQIVPCEPPKDRDLPAWIMRHAKEAHGLTLQAGVAAQLADLIGVDLGRIDNELAKLALMSEKNVVTPETIRQGVAFQREQAMWKMTDPLNDGDVREALRRWRQLLEIDPSSEFKAFTWLMLWVQRLARAHALAKKRTPPFAIAKELRIWPADSVGPLLKLADRLGDEGIRSAIGRLVEADVRSKTGRGGAATNVEEFLLSLAA
jgi:DNA polymerase III subunit delta